MLPLMATAATQRPGRLKADMKISFSLDVMLYVTHVWHPRDALAANLR